MPQAQLVGALDGNQPYLKARASLKVPLCKVKPNSSRGSEESQLDAPFSWVQVHGPLQRVCHQKSLYKRTSLDE